MPRLARWTAVLLTTLAASAAAVDRMPGTQTDWSYRQDPITDVNKSFLRLHEVNDVAGDTSLVVRCSDAERPELWLCIITKHQIVDAAATMSDGLPDVVMRLPVAAMVNIQDATVKRIVAGLHAGKRLVVRFTRQSGGQPLTSTFSANGFAQAWQQIRACGSRLAGTAPSAATLTMTITAPCAAGAAPKFVACFFTTCTDASSGPVRPSFVAGRAALCQLAIDTIPNGVRVVRADFRYR
ncbi:hypothetical protein [Deinococcus radiotolerans]|uniref:Uncharacterized protein n=1 Tax=Deinococcus radiotolerans TaxID=1309407 RepID=A0ABQ2FRQ3_9DEIO|nr:hypothetical protein [Deinococcus radiotolerans]GGL20278.1 hypothetical protein GCM10010844_43940 [Deinococcus radiotolerans]